MLAAVQFNNQHFLERAEIDNVRIQRLLAAELNVLKPFGAQKNPKLLLRVRLVAPQRTGKILQNPSHHPSPFVPLPHQTSLKLRPTRGAREIILTIHLDAWVEVLVLLPRLEPLGEVLGQAGFEGFLDGRLVIVIDPADGKFL